MGGSVLKGKVDESDLYEALGLCQFSGDGSEETPRILPLLSCVLEKSVRRNEKSLEGSRRKDEITVFHGSKAPGLSIRQYLDRILRYSSCSNSCFVVAHIYIDRYLQTTGARLTSLNVHRLLITSILIAAKFLDDDCLDNAYYAKVGGVSTAEMNRLEMKLLFSLDFRLHVTPEIFRKYCYKIEKEGSIEYHRLEKDEIKRTTVGYTH
ncbi:hypothetical protein SLEP1_g20547 [Rubroshorea leprosula]|uniref:Cyclin n=1 Tax=Rubroshorea leprosula TaxID=152421 RepID=A0AAV5JDK7_9ROSI|nr:hypothetical protein SLEP1_g20547 [Rubroshorea leprosula]